MNKCEECGDTNITYYKQKRKDGVIVVTARCGNWHHPKRGKPFYPVYNFHLDRLQMLPERKPQEQQRNFLFTVGKND
ncbi:MAG: hypothetical protein NUV80_01965 [Candidatus Berkelbacteria bacterium]|nr:hypothetical protein [Candidatus Berkelbacteria bacterium]